MTIHQKKNMKGQKMWQVKCERLYLIFCRSKIPLLSFFVLICFFRFFGKQISARGLTFFILKEKTAIAVNSTKWTSTDPKTIYHLFFKRRKVLQENAKTGWILFREMEEKEVTGLGLKSGKVKSLNTFHKEENDFALHRISHYRAYLSSVEWSLKEESRVSVSLKAC